MNKNYYIASVSGGKDSCAMLHLIIEDKLMLDEVIYIELEYQYPEVENVIRKLKKLSEDNNIKFTIIRPEHNFTYYFTEYKRKKGNQIGKPYGFPSIRSRWCTKALKIYPARKYKKQLLQKYDNVIEYIGYSYDEINRANKIIKRDSMEYRFPLINKKITEKMAVDFCKDRGINWDGLYNYIDRASCTICPLINNKEKVYLIRHRPEIWNEIKRIEDLLRRKRVKEWKFTPKYSAEEIERRLMGE